MIHFIFLLFLVYAIIVLTIWTYCYLEIENDYSLKKNFLEYILGYLMMVFCIVPLYIIVEIVVKIVDLFDK